jgi:VWFA-related protein
MRLHSPAPALVLLVASVVALASPAPADDDPTLWPENQRAFLQDGPGLLIPRDQEREFRAMTGPQRDAFIERFMADPLPETEENEFELAIDRRRKLVRFGMERAGEYLSPLDVRAQLLFLHGPPFARHVVECGVAFRPLEIWSYGNPEAPRRLVLYRNETRAPFRLWLPIHSKRALYTSEMEYWLQQWEEYKGRIRGKRFDIQACPDSRLVDEATGVDGLFGFRQGRPTDEQLSAYLAPPPDLAAWAREASATRLPREIEDLAVESFDIYFPDRNQQRIVSRFFITLPSAAELEPWIEDGREELRIGIEGFIEQDGEVFDDFRVLFTLEPPTEGVPVAMSVDSSLRPGRNYVVRMRIHDEVGGRETIVKGGFRVPSQPEPEEAVPVPEEAVLALAEDLSERRIAGADSLILVPPESDVVIGLWRAEALVTGENIRKVVFLLDGKPQMTRRTPPFTAEMRLAKYPREQIVRAEGYDADDRLVASDDVVINQPTGALRVRILEPRRGVASGERIGASAEVVVPEDRRVESVEFLVNGVSVDKLVSPPWSTELVVPQTSELSYLSVVAVLDDGSRAEDVRFLNAPQYLEEVDVNLVELYTSVSDGSKRLVKGLTQDDFRVLEDGRPQELSKFELVEDLPLTLGITIDTSGSMVTALPVARDAAQAFLDNIITPRDRYFAVAFSDRPRLIMAATDDVRAVSGAMEGLQSVGWTTLHDAVVTTLYYFRGVRGRRAMILLSDGDDTASSIPFRDALEYAKRSGVAIYTIGLDVGSLKVAVRKKLNQLADETGGRSYYISDAGELRGVYGEIEEELRSQYLLAYSSDKPAVEGEYRTIEVKMRDRKYKARTIRGYYP